MAMVKRATSMAVMVLAGLALTGCSRWPLLIGFAGSVTGRQSSLGLEGKEAVELAVAEANERGGIDGRLLELIALDDADDPGLAAANHLELERLGAEAIIGHSTSVMMQAAFDALPPDAPGRVPVVSGTVSSPLFSGKRDHFFRVINDSTREGAEGAELLRARGADILAVFYDEANASYALAYAERIATAFKGLGGRVLPLYAFDSTRGGSGLGAAATAALDGMRGRGSAAVAIAAGGVDTALVAQSLRKQGFRGLLLSSAWGKTPDLLINGGEAVEGMLFFENYDASNRSARYLAFAAEFDRRYGRQPNFSAVNHYEAALLVLAALRGRGKGTLLEALGAIRTLEGLQGVIELDEFGDATRPLVLLEARNGSFVAAERP